MPSPRLLVISLALVTSIALGATALATTQGDATREAPTTREGVVQPAGEAESDDAPDTATPPLQEDGDAVDPGTDVPGGTSAQYDCRVIDDREVCDTFDEADEGPGTR